MIRIFIITYVLIMFSCVQRDKQGTGQVHTVLKCDNLPIRITTDNLKEINLDPHDKGYMYDDLIDSVSFIKLQTTDNNLMAYVDQIFFTDNKIIIVDSKKLKAIFVYDYKGNFLYRISRCGEGPDEYRTLVYATLSMDKSQIIVVDAGAKKLKYFSIDDDVVKASGSFLMKSVDLYYNLGYVEFLTDNIIAGYYSVGNVIPNTSDLHKFILSNLNNEIYYSGYKSYYKKNFTFTTDSPLQKFGSNLFFNPSFNDTIFVVGKEGLDARYVINIKGHKNIVENETTTDDDFRKVLKNTDYFNSHFVDLRDIAVFDYMTHVNWFTWGLYLKSENKIYNCNGKFRNPIFSYCHEKSFYYKENTLVKPVSANSLLLNKGALLKNNNSHQLKVIYENLTEDDNPVLLFYHMKTKIE